jgi:hypothetical protein
MTLTAFPNGISSFGMPIIGSGPVFTSGNVFWVDSVNGKSTNDGSSKENAKNTLDAAVALCTANNGDHILLAPNHAETIIAAAGVDLDVAGITVISMGRKEQRATFTFTTDVAADVDIDADDVTIMNILFKTNINDQTAVIDVNKKGFTAIGCEILEGTQNFLTAIDINGGGANACDGAYIKNCTIYCPSADGDRGIQLGEVADRVAIEGCHIHGDFDDAGINNPSGKVLTRLLIINNVVRNLSTGDHAIQLESACTGELVRNMLIGDTLGTILDPGSLFCLANEEVDAIDEASVSSPRSLAAGTSPAANKSIFDAVGFDGNTGVSASAGMLRTMAGTTFIIKKALTSSDVLQVGVDVTGVSSVGEILIEDFILQNDGTGLAAGTNFTMNTDNVNGSVVFCSNAVSGLGADTIIDKKVATVGKSVVLESGKKVVAKCTVADCTGGGVINVYLLCRRLANNATLAAA